MLGSSEDNTALSRALSQLAEVEEKIEQLHHEQANKDFFQLAELLSDYVRLLSVVRVRAPPARAICSVSQPDTGHPPNQCPLFKSCSHGSSFPVSLARAHMQNSSKPGSSALVATRAQETTRKQGFFE